MNEASHSLDRIAAATARLLATAGTLTDDQVRAPSPLPGWTRGHVLSHLARNADGLGNLLRWARTGTETPMYASAEARAADIGAGSGRPAAVLAADVRESAAAFAAEAAGMTADDWSAQVHALDGNPFPAIKVLDRRLTEVEIHHVDLAAGYTPDDWPAEFVAGLLPSVAGALAEREDAPRCLVWAEGTPQPYRFGPEGDGEPRVVIRGRPADLLAWLMGRADGTRLTVVSGGTLPEIPGW